MPRDLIGPDEKPVLPEDNPQEDRSLKAGMIQWPDDNKGGTNAPS